jgi:hypothetical protein
MFESLVACALQRIEYLQLLSIVLLGYYQHLSSQRTSLHKGHLISHSQGTIITLSSLKDLDTDPKVIPLIKISEGWQHLCRLWSTNPMEPTQQCGRMSCFPFQAFDKMLTASQFWLIILMWQSNYFGEGGEGGHLVEIHYLNPINFCDTYKKSCFWFFFHSRLPPKDTVIPK